MRRNGSRGLGVALTAAIGLMALAAPAAQAANLNLFDEPGSSGEPGFFLAVGITTPTGLTHESIGGKLKGTSFFFQIPSKSAEIVCTASEIVKGTESFVENEYEEYIAGAAKAGGHGHAKLLFSNCVVNEINALGELTGKELKACTEVLNGGTRQITLNFLLLVRRHEKSTYMLFGPLVNSKTSAEEANKLTAPISTLTFGGLCPLPPKLNLTGGFTGKVSSEDAIKPVFAFNSFVEAGKKEQELIGAKLKFGAVEFFVNGELELELTGANAGKSWGAM